jgi:hypothetical protein
MCIHCLCHFPLTSQPSIPPLPSKACSALFYNFVEEKTRNNKKDILFLLVWDKDSYTEWFLTLFPCTCVLQPTLVHFYHTSLLLPSALHIVASTNLRLLFSLLNREHINHIQVLVFLSFLYFYHVCSPLSVWLMSNNITAFVLGLHFAYEGEHVIFGLLSLANFT